MVICRDLEIWYQLRFLRIFEQIVNAFVSVFAAYELLNYGYSVSTMLSESKAEANAISYGAAGGTLGTCLGAATALLVLIIIYLKRKSDILADISKQDKGALDSFSRITKNDYIYNYTNAYKYNNL